MPGFNTIPAVGGGGGQANMTYVASVHMVTYNRSWAQGGTAGYYALYSTNQENGYAYFVGSGTSTGAPLNRLISVSHAFTRIDIIAPVNDMISLYKAKVKTTSVYNNPFDADATIGKTAIAAFPSTITSSGNFVLPNNALPLVNVLLTGGGGGAHPYSGGGGGGNVVKLTAYQAVGTTAVTIGAAGNTELVKGGDTYFGNVYALGGGGGGKHDGQGSPYAGQNGGNGGGGGNHNNVGSTTNFGTGTTQTSTTGLGTSGSPAFHGGFSGGYNLQTSHNTRHQGGGGGGSAGAGANRNNTTGGISGGAAHSSDILGTTKYFGAGGGGGDHNANSAGGGSRPDGGSGGIADGYYAHNISSLGYGCGVNSRYNSTENTHSTGAAIVRYYIP